MKTVFSDAYFAVFVAPRLCFGLDSFAGSCGLGGVFSIRRSTSSGWEGVTSAMGPDPIEAFTLIGLITHHFEQCEMRLSELFQLLCEADNEAPFQILGLVVSSNMRLEMTRVAMNICLASPSAIKAEIDRVLQEFKECQTLRNRAIHQSIFPEIQGRNLAFVGMPLPHQTMRYKGGELKPGNKNSIAGLSETSFRISLLAVQMEAATDSLSSFLATRKQRRLGKHTLERGHHKDAD